MGFEEKYLIEEEKATFLLSAVVDPQEAVYLLPGIPNDNITLIVGDGGVGKGFFSCHLAAAVSAGRYCLLDPENDRKDFTPGRVVYLNAEDSFSRVTKQRLTGAGADHEKVVTFDERLPVPTLEDVITCIKQYRPKMVIIDPLQSFVPAGVQMERRNVMRKTLQPLQQIAAEYAVAVVIVMHTNKRANAYGRNRVADSADMWDIARSVFIMGEVGDEDGQVYISHEKNSYGPRLVTHLAKIGDVGRGVAMYYTGETEKRDKDFILERDKHPGGRPAKDREAAEDFIISALEKAGGKMEGKALLYLTRQNDISDRTFERARSALIKDETIIMRSEGFGQNYTTFYSLGPYKNLAIPL